MLDGFKMEPNIEKDGKIGNIITQGTPVLVQITKEAISTKGAASDIGSVDTGTHARFGPVQ